MFTKIKRYKKWQIKQERLKYEREFRRKWIKNKKLKDLEGK